MPMRFNVRWKRADGPRLNELDLRGGNWYISEVWKQPDAARAWDMSWDQWQAESIEGRGVMLAYHRETRGMESWEAQEHKRRAYIRSLTRGNK